MLADAALHSDGAFADALRLGGDLSVQILGSLKVSGGGKWGGSTASALNFDLGMVGVGSSYARGNENNLDQPDGVYYLGSGRAAGWQFATPSRSTASTRSS